MAKRQEPNNLRPAVPLKQPGEGYRGEAGHIGYLLRQAQMALRGALEQALADLGTTVPQFSVLTVIQAERSCSGADLARLSMMTAQSVGGIVQNLERAGLVARTADPAHGRIIRIALTAKGERMVASCRARVAGIEAEMVRGLSTAAERTVRAWLVECARRFDIVGRERAV